MKEPVWVNLDAVLIFHEESILEFGGASGIRERGAIESALARPQNLFAYKQPDLFDLAAAYTAVSHKTMASSMGTNARLS